MLKVVWMETWKSKVEPSGLRLIHGKNLALSCNIFDQLFETWKSKVKPSGLRLIHCKNLTLSCNIFVQLFVGNQVDNGKC